MQSDVDQDNLSLSSRATNAKFVTCCNAGLNHSNFLVTNESWELPTSHVHGTLLGERASCPPLYRTYAYCTNELTNDL